jgi:hypothetical protein
MSGLGIAGIRGGFGLGLTVSERYASGSPVRIVPEMHHTVGMAMAERPASIFTDLVEPG